MSMPPSSSSGRLVPGLAAGFPAATGFLVLAVRAVRAASRRRVRGVPEHQRHVDVPGAQHAQRLGRFRLGQPQVHAGLVFAQHRRRGRDDRAERGRERRQPEPPGAQPGVGGQFVLGGVQPADHLGGALGEEPPGVGEPDAPARPLDQLGPGLGFQPGQVVAHRRLRVVERPCRGRDRTVPGHGDQHAQPGYVEHAPTIDPADRSAQSARPGPITGSVYFPLAPGRCVLRSPPGRPRGGAFPPRSSVQAPPRPFGPRR